MLAFRVALTLVGSHVNESVMAESPSARQIIRESSSRDRAAQFAQVDRAFKPGAAPQKLGFVLVVNVKYSNVVISCLASYPAEVVNAEHTCEYLRTLRLRAKIECSCEQPVIELHGKVNMVAAGHPCLAAESHDLSLCHEVSFLHIDSAEVAVDG